MSEEEARTTCDTIRRGLDEVRDLVLALHDRNGWAALGYTTWKECVETEFKSSYRHVNRQLQAAQIEQEIAQAKLDEKGPIGPFSCTDADGKERLRDSQLLALASVETGKRAEVWQEAVASAPEGKVTAKHVSETVDRKLGKAAPTPKPGPRVETPGPTGKSKVNGQFAADPPDVAKARAAGKLGADVVVEVTDPDPIVGVEEGPCPKSKPDPPQDLSDKDWLKELPLSAQLSPTRLPGFQADALDYRRTESARKTFQHATRRALKSHGEWAYRVRRLLKTDHPKDWLLCPATENGGCGGSGELPLKGSCPKCRGRGYYLK